MIIKNNIYSFIKIIYKNFKYNKKKFKNKIIKIINLIIFYSIKINIIFTNKKNIKKINNNYKKKKNINILTFIYNKNYKINIQSEIILCLKNIKNNNNYYYNNLIHLIIHGILHSQMYNHKKIDNLLEMEFLEKNILYLYNFYNPYK